MRRIVMTAVLLSAGVALAYLPPVDARDGVEVRIGTFDQSIDGNPDHYRRKLGVVEVDGTKPRTFPVTVSNLTDKAVAGTLRVWLNDDWTVAGPSGRLAVPPRTGVTLSFTGSPLDRSLAALYPVHAEFKADGAAEAIHPIAVFMARKPMATGSSALKLGVGSYLLNSRFPRRQFFEVGGKVREVSADDAAVREAFGGHFSKFTRLSAQGVTKRGFSTHPPYKKGVGAVWCDYPLDLPQETPICFSSANMVGSEKSDGVENKVIVLEDGQPPKTVSSGIVRAADGWKAGEADLTPWAGRRIVLRLWTGPGPKNDTAFDGGGWGDPVLSVGSRPALPDEAAWQARERAAVAAARRALSAGGDPAKGSYLLVSDGQRFGAGVVEGSRSLVDGVLAFTDGTNDLVYRGFSCEVDELDASLSSLRAPVKASVSVAPEGALKVSWSMPGAVRTKEGTPRFTRLALGPGSEPAWRAYAGFGNVIEDPKTFRLESNGFGLSTRHVGADYRNGLSLLQASDIVADALECDARLKKYSLVAHHDVTFTFIPGRRGAFETARRFWKICGYRPSPGHDRLVGRMCLDQWGGDYAVGAEGIRQAARYGVTDAFFVKHVWQRWGYDYRLPEIYPPAGDAAAFGELAKACRDTGIFFCPHDNYTDIYPDATGYSYDLVVFNLDGTPQKAWFNIGRLALSYRWAPHAFRPWCLRNAKLLKQGYDPDGVFIDVLTAHGPFDYLDREGRFHPLMETSRCWGDAYQAYREGYGRPDAICVSEAGQDHLVGILDAGQSDHFSATKWFGASAFGDAERTPWHDMATHNRFLLLAGGLGGRYQEEAWHKGGDAALHGYASDDYLNNTVMGGRNPMAEGPCNRNVVKTYWMLHDACASLARAEFVEHAFGDDIHCQHTRFSNGADVWSNRRTNENWTVGGVTLPSYGFLVKVPNGPECGVVLKDGQRVGYARTKDALFVDGRLPGISGGGMPEARSSVAKATVTGPDTAVIETDWEFLGDSRKYRAFVHVEPEREETKGEPIVFQSDVTFSSRDVLTRPGKCRGTIRLKFPASLGAGDYSVRYGMWKPKGGGRMNIEGESDGSRIVAGCFRVSKKDGKVSGLAWSPVTARTAKRLARERRLGVNRAGVPVDFGGIRTAGAVRLAYGKGDWRVTALPGSKAFPVEIDLAAFGAADARVKDVVPEDAKDPQVAWKQDGSRLAFTLPTGCFGYVVRLAEK